MSILLDATGPIADAIEDDTGAVEAAEAADTTDTTAESGGMDSLEDAILGDGREGEEAGEETTAAEPETEQQPEPEQAKPAPEASGQEEGGPGWSGDERLTPKAEAIVAHLEAIREARAAVQAAKWKLEAAKEHVKEMKAKWEQKVADLEKVIDDGPEELPLFDGSHVAEAATNEPPSPSLTGIEQAEQTAEQPDAETAADTPAEDDSWRDVTFEQIGLQSGICTLLREAGMATIGNLADWTSKGRSLTDIAKIGPAKAEKIEDALEKFWATRSTARPTETIDLANHELHEETAEQCLDLIDKIYDGPVTDECDEYCRAANDQIGEILAAIIERKAATIDEVKELRAIKAKLQAYLREQGDNPSDSQQSHPAN